jgi:serine/threonine-protein kinase
MQTSSTVSTGIDPAVLIGAPPATIGRFTVDGEIGRGANGVVYAAHDPILGRNIAIKAIPLAVNDKVRTRAETNFIKEARAVAGLNHPHIVTVFDAGRTDTLAYIAMERLHGRDLHEHLYSGARLSLRQAAALMARIADAVHYAHKRGLIHRDIKPSNIFLSRDMKPKVLDFGVALPRSEQGSAQRSHLIGTPNYMSPEQAQGLPLDARSDVFSLGAILYEMVTGKRAFDAPTTDELLARLVSDQPVPVAELRPDAPPDLVRIIERAMARDVEARYQTAGEMRNDLAAFAGNREAEAASPSAEAGNGTAARRRAPVGLGIGAVAVLAIAGGLWFGLREPPPATRAQDPAPVSGSTTADVAVPLAGALPLPPPVAAPPMPAEAAANRPARGLPPAGDGQVMLAIAPWGEVLVNGEARGVSPPLTQMRLPPGSYLIEIRNGDLPPLKTRIEVKPGQAQKLTHRF